MNKNIIIIAASMVTVYSHGMDLSVKPGDFRVGKTVIKFQRKLKKFAPVNVIGFGYNENNYSMGIDKYDTDNVGTCKTACRDGIRYIPVIEPILWQTDTSHSLEYDIPKRYGNHSQKVFGDEAIDVASKDLKHCYKTILLNGKINGECPTIALLPLSTNMGFPKEEGATIATKTVVDFVNKYPEAYDTIIFIVPKKSDFIAYQSSLQMLLK